VPSLLRLLFVFSKLKQHVNVGHLKSVRPGRSQVKKADTCQISQYSQIGG